MNFDFTEEQTMLADTVSRYVKDNYDFESRKKIVAAGGFSPKVWSDFAELGLCGLTLPANAGGSEMGSQDTMVVMQALGAGIVVEPLVPLTIIAPALLAQAQPAQRTAVLSDIASGKCIAPAFQEKAARYQLSWCETTAKSDGVHWIISGKKCLVAIADHCEAFIVLARTAGQAGDATGLSLFLVPANEAGVKHIAYPTQDGSRAGDMMFDAVRVPAAALLCSLGEALPILEDAVDAALAAYAAEAIGIMEVLCDMTADYLNTRKQFGIAIGTFQALRHKLAEMRLQLELARSMSWKASMAHSLARAERRRIMSACKLVLGEAMRAVGQGAVQLHGGIAVTLEYSAGHYFKRLTVLEMTLGDSNYHMAQLSGN